MSESPRVFFVKQAMVAGTHHVRGREAGRVLVELVAALTGTGARADRQATDLVREGRVQVDGNICTDPAREMRAGEVIKVLPHPHVKAAEVKDVRILHADDLLVVIEKPPGVTTMREPLDALGSGGRGKNRRRRGRQGTLDEMVARLLLERQTGAAREGRSRGRTQAARRGKRGSKRSSTGLPVADPWHGGSGSRARVIPVHRLDRDTSGLMVFARTPAAQRALEAQFKARGVGRSYLAVVHGHPRPMTITTHIVRDRGDGLRGSAEVWGMDPAGGQRTVTHIEPLEEIGPFSVTRCRLETGRTHQIRIHLSEIGHMLCGEKDYVRRPDGTRIRDESGAPRQALHAEELAFVHPGSGREMRFTSRLAKDLARWLEMVARRVRATRSQSRH